MHKLKQTLGNVGVFALIAALVYLVGQALLTAWPMWQAMMGGPGLLGMLLFWGGLATLVVWLLVGLFSGGRSEYEPSVSRDTAEATLRGRFARGEISAEEYERSLEVLRGRGVDSERGGAGSPEVSSSVAWQRREDDSTPEGALLSENVGHASRRRLRKTLPAPPTGAGQSRAKGERA